MIVLIMLIASFFLYFGGRQEMLEAGIAGAIRLFTPGRPLIAKEKYFFKGLAYKIAGIILFFAALYIAFG